MILLTDYPERFKNLKRVYLFDEAKKEFVLNKNQRYEFEISESHISGNEVKLLFKGYESINEAGKLLKYYVCLPEDEKWKLPDGKFFHYEIKNFKVVNNNDEVGIVTGVENFGGDDLLKVKLNTEESEIFIPDIPQFVKDVNFRDKVITVDLIEGFLK